MKTNTMVLIGVLLLALLLIGFLKGCDASRGVQAKIERGQTGAVIESGMDASNTQANIATNDVATADVGRQNEKDIRDAKGSDAAVANDAHAAGLRALCRRQAYRDRPECRVQ